MMSQPLLPSPKIFILAIFKYIPTSHMCVCVYVCMYVCMYVCITHLDTDIQTHVPHKVAMYEHYRSQ